MNKVLIALGVVLVALLAVGSLATSSAAGGTMHNCPQDGEWAIAVWAGEGTDAGEALGTCGNIEVAYALTPTGAWERYIADIPEINTLETLDRYQGVIALGGPTAPVVPEPTNVSIKGDVPDGCDLAEALTVRTRTAGRGGANWQPKPPTTIEGTLITFNLQFMAVVEEFYFYCDGQFLQRADVPEARGSDHAYTITILVSGNEYEILPREHEYRYYDCGLRPDGSRFRCRLDTSAQSIPPNPTCPVRWEWHDDTGMICPGYPDAEWGAFVCDNPPEGKQYCTFFDR